MWVGRQGARVDAHGCLCACGVAGVGRGRWGARADTRECPHVCVHVVWQAWVWFFFCPCVGVFLCESSVHLCVVKFS